MRRRNLTAGRRRAVLLLAAVAGLSAQMPAQAQAQPLCTVALDIGHHRAAPGATSACGVPEWVFNHRLGLLVEQALRRTGMVQTVLINPDGDTISLIDRTRRAADAKADLFLSIHHDSVQDQYLQPWRCGDKAQSYSDRFSGYGLFVSGRNVQFAASQTLATTLGASLRARQLTPSLHHAEPIPHENRPLLDAERGVYQFDDLVVLHSAAMPAVLLEAGIIVNRTDEQDLRGDVLPPKIAAAVAEAVAAYCTDHPAPLSR